MRIPNNVIAFAKNEDNLRVYERFVDYVNEYKAIKEGAKVSFDTSKTFAEKEEKLHEDIRAEISRVANFDANLVDASQLVTNPMYQWATFAVIGSLVDAIIPQTIIDSVGMYTEVKVGGFGDSFSFEIKPRDLFVVSKGSRGKRYTNVQKFYNGMVTVVPEEKDITVGVSLYRVLSGKENLAEFAMRAARSLETEMTVDCFNAFSTAMEALPISATPDASVDLKVAGFSQNTAVALAQKVTAFNNGAKAIFLGTQVAISQILPNQTDKYRISIDSDYVKTGYIRTAFGVDIVELPQVADWKTPFKVVLPDNRIYVISPSAGKPVKLCIEGSTITIAGDVYGNANLTQPTTMKKMYGVGVATSAISGLITLS